MELREYQKEDVAHLLTRHAMGVFNEQRTGKTPTSIMTMESRGINKLLVVCPASLVYVWAEEYNKWTGKTAIVITSATKDRAKGTVKNWTGGALIINYENLRTGARVHGLYDELLKAKPDGLIVDEAHRIKSRKSANYRAVLKFKNVPYRLMLTGTPAPNTQADVFPLLQMLCPQKYTSYWAFIDQYFDTVKNWVTGTDTPTIVKADKQVEFAELIASYSIMRKRRDVMPWLPNNIEPTVVKLPCTPTQARHVKNMSEFFETEDVIAQNVLEQVVRLRQICAAPAILGLRGNSPKIEWLSKFIVDYPEKSIIVFSNSTKFIKLIAETLGVTCFIYGDVSLVDRKAHLSNFQSGKSKVILIQTQAGKEGLTLDSADVTIFLDVYPPAADYMQAKDRMVATTEERNKPKELYHVMMKDTYDQHLYELVNNNISTTEIVNDYKNYLKRRVIK